ncbi:MAG: PIN domain-containing protein [archaeon]
MTESKIFVDTSIWLDYFLNGSKESKQYLESGEYFLLTSVISIHEIKRKLLKEKYELNIINNKLDFIKTKSALVDIEEKICEKSAIDAIEHKLNTADAIIYRSSIEQAALLITLDYNFKGLKGAKVI